LSQAGVHRRTDRLYQQLDALVPLRRDVRRELLSESRKHPASQLLREIPRLGAIRVALLMALLQTPHRFRTKRQLWAYCGLALQTRISGEYRFTGGHLQAAKKPPALRGLNANHNHDLKNPGQMLPSLHHDVDVLRIQFYAVAHALGYFRGGQCGAAAKERLIN
jgi:hypothetical protein